MERGGQAEIMVEEQKLSQLRALTKSTASQLEKLRKERDDMVAKRRTAMEEEFFAKATAKATSSGDGVNGGEKMPEIKAAVVDLNKKMPAGSKSKLKSTTKKSPITKKAAPKKAGPKPKPKIRDTSTKTEATSKVSVESKKEKKKKVPFSQEEREDLRNSLERLEDTRESISKITEQKFAMLMKARKEIKELKEAEVPDRDELAKKLKEEKIAEDLYKHALAKLASQSNRVLHLKNLLSSKQASVEDCFPFAHSKLVKKTES